VNNKTRETGDEAMTEIIIYKIETFVILMLLGVLTAKIGILKKGNLPTLSGLLTKITFPCLGFALIYDANTSITDLFDNAHFIFFELLLSAFLLILGVISMKLFKLPNSTKQIHVIQTMFGNQGFINIPILMSLFTNGEANVYIALFTLVDQILLWSLGIMIMSSSDPTNGGIFSPTTIKKILNPMNVCMMLAVVFTSLHIKLPTVISETVTSVGNVSFSLALIFLGATLSYVSLKSFKYLYDYAFLVIVKMFCVPILVGLVVSHYVTPIETTILTLMAAMPAMSAIPMMAQSYHSDSEFASQTVFIMTACSAITIPGVFYVLGLLGVML
jgi:hypothetical protein